MTKFDYCIVGGGYAGIFFAHQCLQNGKSFLLYDEGNRSASKIAAGMVNPVVLKKFTPFWNANEQIQFFTKIMAEMEAYLGDNFFQSAPIYRIFHDESEVRLWQKKRERADLLPFLASTRHHLPFIENEHGCGSVSKGGYLRVAPFFEAFYAYLKSCSSWKRETFDYALLDAEHGRYKDMEFRHIVFCEGMRAAENPFFHPLPIRPNKGHQMEVEFEGDFRLDAVVKKKHFLIPLSTPGRYYYGGTYDRADTSEGLNPSAIEALKGGIAQITATPYRILEISAAFRPTVPDRRPIIANHPKYNHLYLFNGLGARGLLNGAYYAWQLFAHITHRHPIDAQVRIERFETIMHPDAGSLK